MERACFRLFLLLRYSGRRWGEHASSPQGPYLLRPISELRVCLETEEGQTSICSIRKASMMSPSLISWNFSKVMPHS